MRRASQAIRFCKVEKGKIKNAEISTFQRSVLSFSDTLWYSVRGSNPGSFAG